MKEARSIVNEKSANYSYEEYMDLQKKKKKSESEVVSKASKANPIFLEEEEPFRRKT